MALLPLMLIVLVMIGVFFLMDQPRPWRALLITTVLTAFAILTLVWIVRATDSFSDGRAGLAALGMILLLAACVCVSSGVGAAIGQAPLAWRDTWPTIIWAGSRR